MVSALVQPRLLAILSEQLYYDEIAIPFTRMQNECKQLLTMLADAQVEVRDHSNCSVFTIDQANELVRHRYYYLVSITTTTQFYNSRLCPSRRRSRNKATRVACGRA